MNAASRLRNLAMPGKWSGERSCGVLDVNDTAVHGTRGRARSVK